MKFFLSILLPQIILALAPGVHSATTGKADQIIATDNMFMNSPPGAPLLSDVIGLKQCTIMSDYTMNLENLARRLADSSKKTLLLAPLNSAIVALPRKPWLDGPEDPADPSISPLKNEDRAAKNIEAFVVRHIVDQYPVPENQEVRNMAGDSVSWETRAGEKYINGKYKVVLEKEAANGAIWVISGVIEGATRKGVHEGL